MDEGASFGSARLPRRPSTDCLPLSERSIVSALKIHARCTAYPSFEGAGRSREWWLLYIRGPR